MKASMLVDTKRMEVREIADPVVHPQEVLVRLEAVGICGSDVHVYGGHVNWNVDASGASIPFSSQPQILGHEMVGVVVDHGREVTDLELGDRVVLDQGINCASRGRPRESFCEYCSTGFSHHCVNYEEHGITGLPGGFADCIAIPAVNAVRIEGDLPSDLATMVEPLGCVLHNLRLMTTGNERFSIDADDPRARIKNIAICGLGPSGQIFGKALRNILGFEGTIIVTDPRSSKLQLAAASFDGTPIKIDGSTDVPNAIRGLTDGSGCELLIDACGAPAAWADFAAIIRKQATAVLYGFGRERGGNAGLDCLQWRGARLITSSGASGPIDPDGRSGLYRECLGHLQSGRIDVRELITHRYTDLEQLEGALAVDPTKPDYLKGVLVRSSG
ncbi:MAG: alcohol dehydrogenase catalytic domain-containing protein [Phycisphaerales bacterium]